MTATESTRVHEAGHAVAAVELRIGLRYVSVEPEAWSSGHAMYRKLSKGQENYMASAVNGSG